jgi:hypothetical protein
MHLVISALTTSPTVRFCFAAITIIVVMLVLFVRPAGSGQAAVRRCPVCDHELTRPGKYCPEFGSGV